MLTGNNPLESMTDQELPETEITGQNPAVGQNPTGNDNNQIWGKLLNFGLDLAKGFGNWISGRKRRKKADDQYQKELADTRALRDEANAYNHPKEQIKRLIEAGLNPHLLYGNGTAATGQSSTSSAPSRRDTEFESPLAFMQNLDPLMFLKAESLKEDVRSKKIDNDQKEKINPINAQILKNQQHISANDVVQSNDMVHITGQKLEQSYIDTAVANINRKIVEDPNSGAAAMATLKASIMQIGLAFTEKTNPLKIEQMIATIRSSQLNNEIAEKNIRILEQQAQSWERGVKPNATVFEQYMDEFLYALTNTEDPNMKAILKTVTDVPVIGPLILAIINNRRSAIGRAPISLTN